MLVRNPQGRFVGRCFWPALALLILAALLRAMAGPAQAAPKALALETWTLDNGLKVVFAARQGAPLVSVQIVYHVGSRDEKPGQHGIARVMREMMFRGSHNVPPGVHSRLIGRVGGRVSSAGDEDLTSFHNTVAAPYLDFVLALEADRMRALKLFDDTLENVKRSALAARQRQVEQNAVGKALDLLRSQMLADHAYENGGAGAAADLRRLSLADCQAFYDQHFVPNNATLVIAGASTSAEVRQLVLKHFGALAPGDKPLRALEPPAPALGVARAVRLPIEMPMVALGAVLPPLNQQDRAALTVLSEALAGGSAGLLTRNLVGPGLPAVAAGGAPAFWQHGGMFVLFAVHRPDRPQEEVRRALLDQVANARQAPMVPAVLAQAKLAAAEAVASRLATAAGLAQELGRAAALEGNAENALLRPEHLLAVTASDVGRVANLYLSEDKLSLLLLSPEGVGLKPSKAAP